jgi:hypothetical protein
MVSEPTVSRYLKQLNRRRDEGKAQGWLTFLNNHREVIAAFDFFTVPKLTFRTVYYFGHRTWPATPSPFQLHGASNLPVDRAAS